jgi:hypothetical protein
MTVREVLVRAKWPVADVDIDGLDDSVEEAVRSLHLTAEKVGWNVHDHLGGSSDDWPDRKAEFCELLQAATPVEAASSGGLGSANPVSGSENSWEPIQLTPFLDGSPQMPTPTVLRRTDGEALFYSKEVHTLAGESGVGKGWIALEAASQEIRKGRRVVYIDFEDGPASITARLRAIGVDLSDIASNFAYVRPEVPLTTSDATATLDHTLDTLMPRLVVIDGVTEAMQLHGLDPNNNPDAAKFLMMFPRRIADHPCEPAVVLIDHVTKERDRKARYALGAQHKRAGSAVTYMVEAKRPIERGRDDGLVRISVAKDRHGAVQRFGAGSSMPKPVAEMHVAANSDGTRVTIRLEPSGSTSSASSTRIRDSIHRYLNDHPGASQNRIVDDVAGNTAAKRRTLSEMIGKGEIRYHQDGQTRHHYLVAVFGPDTDPERRSG